MKTYGVNWFLVWVGLMVWMCPVCAWLRELIYSHPGPAIWVMILMQTSVMSVIFTCSRYSDYSKTLADPLAMADIQRRRQRRSAARRHRWLIACVTVSATVAAVSVMCKAILDRPSWLHVIGYSLLLPCFFVASSWLTNKAANEGQMAHLLKGGLEDAP